MWIPLLLAACSQECPPGSARNAAGLCELFPEDSAAPETDTTDTADTDTDTDTDPTESLSLGDPIEELGGTASSGTPATEEWVDAVVLDEQLGVLAGVGGTVLFDHVKREVVAHYNTNRTYRVDADPDDMVAIVGTIHDGLRRINLSSGDVRRYYDGPSGVGHADVSISGGVVLVAWRSAGAWLMDTEFNTLAVIDATAATAAVIRGDRALYTDEEALILLDVSDPTQPAELARAVLPADGYDLDFDGTRAAVSLGGRGVVVFDVTGDTLTSLGALEVPGTAQGVALDGDYLWIGSWAVTALAWLGDGAPVVVGHEDPRFSAMAVGARDGIALVADWASATVLRRSDGLGGPEIHLKDQITFQRDTDVNLTVDNYGAFPLSFSAEQPGNGFSIAPASLTLEPGASGTITVTPPSGSAPNSQLTWSSDDPDEPSGRIRIMAAEGGAGSAHPDFELVGFTWPDKTLQNFRLADYKGKAVFLSYWADY